MSHRFLVGLFALLLSGAPLMALEAVGTVKSVDADTGTVVVFANGQDRTLKADTNLKVLDTDGKDLADGLKSKELKAGGEVTVIVERASGQVILTSIRLGAQGRGKPERRPDNALRERTSVGFKPLTEMSASDRYKGEDGGLYGGGQNVPPPAHQAAADKETAKITTLDSDGKPSPSGKIALVSISMSNATQEFSTFKRIADADPQKSPLLTIVDCAQGCQAMAQWATPDARAWAEADRRLTSAGVSPKQVQIAWVKLANVRPTGELAEHGKKLYDDTLAVVQIAKQKFPNLRVAYLGSRIYAGYAGGALNPEPYAYEGAFVVRWLIRDQAKGEAALNFDAAKGPAKTPLLLWGPYFWGDGMTPRKSDGLIWERTDLAGDGTHPSDSGRRKVANMLLSFFKADEGAKTWFGKK
jgi:hypothetical protein